MTKKKPTSKDWSKIEALFLQGEKPRFIVDKFPNLDITPKSISTKFSKMGLGEQKKKIEVKTKEVLIDKITEDKIDYNLKHINLFDKNLKLIDALLDYRLKNVEQAPSELVISDIVNDATALIRGICAGQKGQRLALGLDKLINDDNDSTPVINTVENLDDKLI